MRLLELKKKELEYQKKRDELRKIELEKEMDRHARELRESEERDEDKSVLPTGGKCEVREIKITRRRVTSTEEEVEKRTITTGN